MPSFRTSSRHLSARPYVHLRRRFLRSYGYDPRRCVAPFIYRANIELLTHLLSLPAQSTFESTHQDPLSAHQQEIANSPLKTLHMFCSTRSRYVPPLHVSLVYTLLIIFHSLLIPQNDKMPFPRHRYPFLVSAHLTNSFRPPPTRSLPLTPRQASRICIGPHSRRSP